MHLVFAFYVFFDDDYARLAVVAFGEVVGETAKSGNEVFVKDVLEAPLNPNAVIVLNWSEILKWYVKSFSNMPSVLSHS